MKILIPFLLSIFILSGAVQAQTLEDQLDELLNARYPSAGPGATALVAKGGEIVYQKAFGMANLELAVPMRPEMVFRIASISKQFTAIGILMLMEQGKLSLDDDLTQYIPDYPTEGQHVSLRHLLTHTSGFSRDITLNPWDANIRRHHFSTTAFIDYFKEEPKRFSSGEAYQYNNFNYILLGHIIELVSGMSYGDFMEQNIFTPLGMLSSRQANDSDVVPNLAYGYERNEVYVRKVYVSPSTSLGAGSLMSTVEDLYRWNRGLREGKLVSPETLEMAYSNHVLANGQMTNYGFGWFVNEIKGSPTLEHAGGIHGYRLDAIYLPDEDVFVALFANCSCGEPRPLSTKIAALTIGKPYTQPALTSTNAEALYPWVGKYTFQDGSSRNVTMLEDKIYWVMPNGTKLPMLPTSDRSFVLENGITQIDFELIDNAQVEVRYKSRISEKTASRPYTERIAISLPEADIAKYVGRYQLFPEFSIMVALENGQLTAAGTRQDPLPIYPESPTRFFFRALDSYIDFLVDAEGKPTALEITQDGATYPGTKVE